MNRSTRLVTAALTASAALLLAACGSGGGGSSASGKIKGADGRGKASASADPSASAAAGGAARPKIPFPSTFTMTFEGWTNSDAKLQAILNDGKEALRADHAAIIAGDPDADYVTFYNSPSSAAISRKWIKGFVDDDQTLVGRARVFDPKVSVNSTGSGVLFYCVDESQGSTKNRKTGELQGTPKGESPHVQYRTLLDRSKNGVWKTMSSTTAQGAC